MKHEQIIELLEKYVEGETTLAEEDKLREYFMQEPIHESLRLYQPLFRYFAEESRQELSAGFDDRLTEALKQENTKRQAASFRLRRLQPVLARVAAVIVLAAGVWYFYPRQEAPQQQAGIDWSKYEPETPEEAYRITRLALLKASGKMNEGASMAAEELDRVGQLGRFFKSSAASLNKISY